MAKIVTLPVIPKLSPKDAVSYEIIAKGVKAGDGHTKFTLSSDMLQLAHQRRGKHHRVLTSMARRAFACWWILLLAGALGGGCATR